MTMIQCHRGDLTPQQQEVVTRGFERHSQMLGAPRYHKESIHWLAHDNEGSLVGTLTATVLWDWMYIDELWVSEKQRGKGLGKQFMQEAEHYALAQSFTGIWLWTQSWQAADFYTHLGYTEFTRFPDFPKGYARIGFCKHLTS